MSSYNFRIRFVKSVRDTINIDSPSWEMTLPDSDSQISLRSTKKDISIRESKNLAFHGNSWNSKEEAGLVGEICQDALMLTLVRLRIGADFGGRAPKSSFTQAGLEMLEQKEGKRLLNDFHGLMVYLNNPQPSFISAHFEAVRGVPQEQFEEIFEYAIRDPRQLTNSERISIECFNLSFFQASEDTRFLCLMMAIEALLEPAQRDAASIEHVDRLIALTRESPAISTSEKDSMLGLLHWLRRESISQTGRKLSSERLGNRTYMGRTSSSFFTFCYSLRSRLIHGSTPFPTRDEISNVAANLEVFVSDLLSGPLLKIGP